jgi:hypothetical protein
MAARIELITESVMTWTEENRGRYDRRGQRYPSDMTNEEWIVLEPLLPVPQGKGRPRRYALREIMNGIRYVLRYGIPWDAMPIGTLQRPGDGPARVGHQTALPIGAVSPDDIPRLFAKPRLPVRVRLRLPDLESMRICGVRGANANLGG